MAKRARGVSIDGLIAELLSLDERRQRLIQQIQGAVANLLPSGGKLPDPFGPKRGRPAGNTEVAAPPRKRNRKPMTAAQRKAVGERMRKYWAARRKAKAA